MVVNKKVAGPILRSIQKMPKAPVAEQILLPPAEEMKKMTVDQLKALGARMGLR